MDYKSTRLKTVKNSFFIFISFSQGGVKSISDLLAH